MGLVALEAPRSSTARVVPALVGVGVAILVLARLAATPQAFDRVWAEDATTFLSDAAYYGWGSFATQYAGYAHTVPRAWALLGAALPIGWFAVFAAVASAVTAGGLAAFVAAASQRVTGSAASAVFAGLMLGAAPALRHEIVGSLANLQWVFLAPALWAVLLPAGRLRVAAPVVAGLAALTAPLALFVLPAAAVLHGRRAVRHPAVLALISGLVVQVAVMVFGPVAAEGPRRQLRVVNVVAAGLDHIAGTGAPVLLAVLLVVAMAAVIGAGWVQAREVRRPVFAVLVTTATFVVGGSVITGAFPSRYVAGAFLLASAAVAYALPHLPRRGVVVAAVPLLVAVVVSFTPSPYRVSGTSWEASTTEHQQSCRAGAVRTAVPVSPPSWRPADLPCA